MTKRLPARQLTGTIPITRDNNGTKVAVPEARIEAGWGYVGMASGTNQITKAVSFNQTFATIPIITATSGGDSTTAGSSLGSGGNNIEAIWVVKVIAVTTSGFTVQLNTARGNNITSAANVYFHWSAIG